MGEWFVLFLIILVALFIVMLATAPQGYEDEDGFHYGPEQKFHSDQIRENNQL
jgi:hypothetical protein